MLHQVRERQQVSDDVRIIEEDSLSAVGRFVLNPVEDVVDAERLCEDIAKNGRGPSCTFDSLRRGASSFSFPPSALATVVALSVSAMANVAI
jgi:hypothetical protein